MATFGEVDISGKLKGLLGTITKAHDNVKARSEDKEKLTILRLIQNHVESERSRLEEECLKLVNSATETTDKAQKLAELEKLLVPFNMILDNALMQVSNEAYFKATAVPNHDFDVSDVGGKKTYTDNLGALVGDGPLGSVRAALSGSNIKKVKEFYSGAVQVRNDPSKPNWMDDGYFQLHADQSGKLIVLKDPSHGEARIYWPINYGIQRYLTNVEAGKKADLEARLKAWCQKAEFTAWYPGNKFDTMDHKAFVTFCSQERERLTEAEKRYEKQYCRSSAGMLRNGTLNEADRTELTEHNTKLELLAEVASLDKQIKDHDADVEKIKALQGIFGGAPAGKLEVEVFSKTQGHYFKETGVDTCGNGSCGWNVRTRARLVKACSDGSITHTTEHPAGKGGNGASHAQLQIIMDALKQQSTGLLDDENIGILKDSFDNVVSLDAEAFSSYFKDQNVKIQAQLVEEDKAWLKGLLSSTEVEKAAKSKSKPRPSAFFTPATITSVLSGSERGDQAMVCTFNYNDRKEEKSATVKVHYSRGSNGNRTVSHFEGDLFTKKDVPCTPDLIEQVTKMLDQVAKVEGGVKTVRIDGFDQMSDAMKRAIVTAMDGGKFRASNEEGAQAIQRYKKSTTGKEALSSVQGERAARTRRNSFSGMPPHVPNQAKQGDPVKAKPSRPRSKSFSFG